MAMVPRTRHGVECKIKKFKYVIKKYVRFVSECFNKLGNMPQISKFDWHRQLSGNVECMYIDLAGSDTGFQVGGGGVIFFIDFFR